jgi:hypothetical protein
MERDEITWNDLPNEIHEHIFQYLDITQEPGLILTVRLLSKKLNRICSSDNMMIEWYKGNFTAHLPPTDQVQNFQLLMEDYFKELKAKNRLYVFVISLDLEILARKMLRRRKIFQTPMEIQAIFANNSVYCLKELAASVGGPNYVVNFGRTLLHCACYYNAYECVKLLLEMGANVHVRENTWQQTPLHIAVQRGGKKLIEILLEYKSDMLVQDKDLLTPLQMCDTYGDEAIKVFAKEYKAAHGLK